MSENNFPTEPGLYWARHKDTTEWNLIADVVGSAPFLRVYVYNRSDKEIRKSTGKAAIGISEGNCIQPGNSGEVSYPTLLVYSPKIEEPE